MSYHWFNDRDTWRSWSRDMQIDLWQQLLEKAPIGRGVFFRDCGYDLGDAVLMVNRWVLADFVHSDRAHMLTVPEPAREATRTIGDECARKLWAALRILKAFDVETLACSSENGIEDTRFYVDALAEANYLRRVEGHWQCNCPSRRKAPIIRRFPRHARGFATCVHDPNTGRTIELAESAHIAVSAGGVS